MWRPNLWLEVYRFDRVILRYQVTSKNFKRKIIKEIIQYTINACKKRLENEWNVNNNNELYFIIYNSPTNNIKFRIHQIIGFPTTYLQTFAEVGKFQKFGIAVLWYLLEVCKSLDNKADFFEPFSPICMYQKHIPRFFFWIPTA